MICIGASITRENKLDFGDGSDDPVKLSGDSWLEIELTFIDTTTRMRTTYEFKCPPNGMITRAVATKQEVALAVDIGEIYKEHAD